MVDAFELSGQTAFRAADLLHRWKDADLVGLRYGAAAADDDDDAALPRLDAGGVLRTPLGPRPQRAALLRAAACVLVASKVEDVGFVAVEDLVQCDGDL